MLYQFCVVSRTKQRVDLYLSEVFEDFSRSYIQKLIDQGMLKVNEKVVKKNIKIEPRDEISLEIHLEKLTLKAENLPLEIIYEDANLAIINKDAGINVHPTPGLDGKSGTLVNALLYHIKDLGGIGGVERPGIVHRLDKDTSGLLMIAKNDPMMLTLQKMLHDRTHIGKYYLAIVKGRFEQNECTIESQIGRHPHDRTKMTVRHPLNPRQALSHVRFLNSIDDEYSLLEVKIDTGRTHQIRVHLASIGFPIIGDKVYGDKLTNSIVASKFNLHRQALHAYKLEIELYGTLHVFYAPLKEDMKSIIDLMNQKSK